MKNILPPIIVTGGPRSGTTLTMRILQAAGMQLGRTAEFSELREGLVRDNVYKPILERGGFDPLAQTDLPPVGWYPDIKTDELRQLILDNIQIDDLTKPWGFKAVKGLLFWRAIADAFPGSKWITVYRERQEHIDSLLRTPFMTAYQDRYGWGKYLDQIDAHMDDLAENGPLVYDVDPSRLRDGDTVEYMAMLDAVGLKWTGQCEQQFNPSLYRRHNA